MSRTTGILFAALGLVTPALGQQSPPGTYRLRVALVLEDLQVRAVPLHRLTLASLDDSSFVVPIQTDLSGEATGDAPAGFYRLQSTAPARLQGITYSWTLDLALKAGETTSLELTNANASIDSSGVERSLGGRQIEDAVTSYRRLRDGVFRIEAGLGHGSGFLVDTVHGLVVTNAHVVSGTVSPYVVLDSATRTIGRVLARSDERDIAVIQVHPSHVADRPRLELADPRSTASIVESGERVLAIGYPLNQEQTLTTGIASSIREGAILSDVNINPGNSGGPMLNYAGVVVGINTFADMARQGPGPGVSGAVVATEIWPILEAARLAMDTVPAPDPIRLPTMPRESYPLDVLKSFADATDVKELRNYESRDLGPFEIAFSSPASLRLQILAYEREIAKDRKKREQAAGLTADERYSHIRELRQWHQYAGDWLSPVVGLSVKPKAGETTGSVLGRIFVAAVAGVGSKATYKFQGDVRGVTVYRNGSEVHPLRGGHAPLEVYEDNGWVQLKDVADAGYYLLSPDMFRPDSLGTPPMIVLAIDDLKNPDKVRCGEVGRATVARLWNDFLPLYRHRGADSTRLVPADPRRNPKKYAPWDASDSTVTTAPERCGKVSRAPEGVDCNLNPNFCR